MAKCYICGRTFYKVYVHAKKFHPRKFKQIQKDGQYMFYKRGKNEEV